MTDFTATLEVSDRKGIESVSQKVKAFLAKKKEDAILTVRHWIRRDGFPGLSEREWLDVTRKVEEKPKVLDLYYLCVNCDKMVPVNRHLECEVCGSTQIMPIQKPADPKHDIRRLLADAQTRMEEKRALEML